MRRQVTCGSGREGGAARISILLWSWVDPWVVGRLCDIYSRGRYAWDGGEEAWDAGDSWGVGEYEKKNYYIRYDDAVFVIYGEDLSEQETVDAIRQKLKLG